MTGARWMSEFRMWQTQETIPKTVGKTIDQPIGNGTTYGDDWGMAMVAHANRYKNGMICTMTPLVMVHINDHPFNS